MQELILDLSSACTYQLPSAPAAVIRSAPVDHGDRGAYGDATVEAFIADLNGLHSKVSRRLAMNNSSERKSTRTSSLAAVNAC